MMKILIYSSNSIYSGKPVGGAEHSLHLLARKLSERGHNVHFVTDSYSRLTQGFVDKDSQKFNIHFSPSISLPFQRLGFLKRLNALIKGVVVRWYLSCNFSDFDIAHTYNEEHDAYLLLKWKEKKSLNIKIVIRVAGLYWKDIHGIESSKKNKKIEYIYNNVDSVNFIQNGMKILFFDTTKSIMKIEPQDSFILDIGDEINNNKAQWSTKPRTKPFRIVMVARLSSYQKRQDILIKAFENLNFGESELLFLGDGPELGNLTSYCNSNTFLKDRVKFLGYQSKEEVKNILLSSDLFCMCTEYEGLCKGVIEAMKYGVPVLTSNVLAISDYLENGINGFLVDNNVEDWSKALSYCINLSDDALKEISENEIRFIRDNFDADKNVTQYEKEFMRIMNTN